MITTLTPCWNLSNSEATSFEAVQVDREIESRFDRLFDTETFGASRQAGFTELLNIAETCSIENWDGQGAAPISHDTYLAGYRVIEALPIGTPFFTVGAEPDGHLTLEWYRSPDHTLSVSISPDGDLHYAALIGGQTPHDSKHFLGYIPDEVLSLVTRVMAGSEKP